MVDSVILLFESTATTFTTNGLGALPDATVCQVTEERNGMFELEMKYPITGRHYNELSLRRIILAKSNPYSTPQPFRIYSITKPINGIVTVNAAHISYDLSGYPVSPFSAGSVAGAFTTMESACIVDQPFTFWTDKTTTATLKTTEPASIRSLLGGSEGSFLDVYGGEYEFDGFTVKLHNNRGMDRGVTIRYGKNMTDLKQEENCSNVYTGVYPFWYSEDSGIVQLPEKYVNCPGTYDFVRILTLDLTDRFENQPSVDQLRNAANSYITTNNIGVPKISLTVSFEMLSQFEEYKHFSLMETVHLCDTVTVQFEELGVSGTAKCISTLYNVLTNKYVQLELGEARSNLSTGIVEQNQKNKEQVDKSKSFLEKSIERATQLITGGLGGYVVIHSSTGDGYPDEILIMDTDDIYTATQVWRWNKGGLGYSATGYNGPYRLAMTQDGHFNADFIDVGTLTANVMRTGVLKSIDKNETFYLDLQAGILRMKATELSISGQTVSDYVDSKASDVLEDFINGDYKDTIDDIRKQADQKAETWYQATDPSIGWNSAQKAEHKGDLWYDTSSDQIYIYDGTKWVEPDFAIPQEVFDKIDGKAKIFVSQPVPPYHVGDLWFQSASTGIKVCKTERLTGSYQASDWEKRDDYINKADAEAAAKDAVDAQTQMDIFNKLTNNGKIQGIYIQDGQLYINATYIHGGILKLGGLNNQNGTLEIYDSSGNLIGGWSVNGINTVAGSIAGWTITKDTIQKIDNSGLGVKIGSSNYSTTEPGSYFSCVGGSSSRRNQVLIREGNIFHNYNDERLGFSGLTVSGSYKYLLTEIYSGCNGIQWLSNGAMVLFYAEQNNLGYTRGTLNIPAADLICHQGLTVKGTKNRMVETDNYDSRLLYSYEMPSPMFGDTGEARLDETGECYISIDDIFSETVSAKIEYQVFLQKEGPGDLWVAEKTPQYFVVKGTEMLKFAWEIKAKQRDYEYERLETMGRVDKGLESAPDYVGQYIKQLEIEQKTNPYDSIYDELLEEDLVDLDLYDRLYSSELNRCESDVDILFDLDPVTNLNLLEEDRIRYSKNYIKQQEEMLYETA